MKNLENITCQCGCGAKNTVPGFLEAIKKLETLLGFELVLLSMCRCQAHNDAEGGEKRSEHLATRLHDCCAVDIESHEENQAVRAVIVRRAKQCGFKGFGYSCNFLHMDMGRPRWWFYPDFLKKHPAIKTWLDPSK